MSLYRDEKSPHWFVSITVKGRRIRRSTGTSDRVEAQRIHDEIRAGLWREKNRGYTWIDACTDWLNHEPRGTPDRYRVRVLTEAIPDVPIADLTAPLFQSRITGTAATFNRTAQLITAILNLARKNGHLERVPEIERKKVAEKRIRWLTREEWERLYQYLPEHLRPLAAFSVATGLRQHNATHLEWSQVDMRRRVAWIHADQAKAGKPIGIPLSDDAMAVLRIQRGKNERWVFPYIRMRSGQKEVFPMAQIKGAWWKAVHRAELDGLRWHDLRHTWATWHVQAGTPLEVLQKLGGWSSYSMVLRYAHLAPEYLASYANNATPYESEKRSETA